MKTDEKKDEWITLEEDDPPADTTREKAAYERERARLVRDHLGKIVLVHGDDVVGVFNQVDDAVAEGHRRFGWARMIFIKITPSDESDYIGNVDVNHPSFERTN